MVAAAEANDVQVVVTQNDRFFHPYPLLREIIADRRYGELGAITMVHHNARGRPFENGYPPMHLVASGVAPGRFVAVAAATAAALRVGCQRNSGQQQLDG